MAKSGKRRSRKSGLPPGTLIHIGEQKTAAVKITVIDYDQEHFHEKVVESVEDCFEYKTTDTVTWINVDGLHDISVIETLGRHFGLHPLTMEDILNANQRPKFEEGENYIYIVLKMLTCADHEQNVNSEQVSLIIGRNFILSFQEDVGDVFDIVRDRIRTGKGRVRKMGPDYLAYSLMDAVVDNYFVVLEKLGDRIEPMQDNILAEADGALIRQVHLLKRELLVLRKSVWPLRETISAAQKTDSNLIDNSTKIYFRDLYDHTIQVIEAIETFRDMTSGMLELYVSNTSNRLNAVMKVLTIIATIFIPLTFMAGVYGMNFQYMPELRWQWGYPMALLSMALVAGTMVIYFRKKKWL
jgi:magnesium transporter